MPVPSIFDGDFVYATTVSSSQMYQLFNGYHLGTN
jgi:hypothetical protein